MQKSIAARDNQAKKEGESMHRGIVDQKLEIRKEGIKPFDVLKILGEDYSCFNLGLSKDIKAGDEVNFEFKESEGYKNITKLAITGKHIPVRAVSVQEQIVRMNALTNAVNYILSVKGTVTDAVEVAKIFEKWIRGE